MSVSRPLHILYLVQQFPPEVGAGAGRVLEMARRWVEAGARVTVVTGMPNRPQGVVHPDYRGRLFVDEEWEGIRVLRSWLYASPEHGFARTVANNASFMVTSAVHALVRATKPDVLIASSPPFLPHVAGAAVATLRRIPLVLEVRDLWPDYMVSMGVVRERSVAARALFTLERGLLRRATHAVAVTESFRRRLVQKGMDAGDVTVIPNGIDIATYRPASEPAPIPALQRRGDEFLVGYLGNFGVSQALEAVVDAARILRDVPGIRFVLVGDGTDRRRLERHVAAAGAGNLSVHPPIPKDATRAFYNACDVTLVPLASFPVLQETVPSKIFEVMGCARPVLASLRGEAATITRESGGGVVVEPEDAQGIADAVLRLRAMPAAERAAMGEMGRAYAIAHYSREVLADRYLDLLLRLTGRSAEATASAGTGEDG